MQWPHAVMVCTRHKALDLITDPKSWVTTDVPTVEASQIRFPSSIYGSSELQIRLHVKCILREKYLSITI